MFRGALISIAILGLAACGQGERGTPAVGAEGGAAVSPEAATCIEMVSAENWAEAARLCALALNADPGDEKVKAALAAANAALAGDAADSAAETAEEAAPN